MSQWYVIHTKPRMESVAVENLERQGYTTYCPQILKAKFQRQNWHKVNEPLFPRYLFVQLVEGVDSFAPIRSTMGVRDMVRFSNQPASISQYAIEAIQQQECSLLRQVGSDSIWKSGDKVEIINGPFAGLNGVFQKENNEERVTILLEILGRNNRVTVNSHSVTLA